MTENNTVIWIIAFAVGFLLGVTTGWLLHGFVSKKAIPNWERSYMSIVVTTLWGISILFDIAISSYSTPVAVHAVMGLVAGFFFEGNIKDFIAKK